LADATLSLSYIGRLHRVPGAAPAAGSCRNVAGSCVADQYGWEDRLDNDPISTLTLHLHSIAAAELWYYSSSYTSTMRGTGVPVEKKIKKDLTSRITWDIKGVLTRKTKGK
jgi:hypothetical protein